MRHIRQGSILVLALAGALCACNTRVNSPIVVDDGQTRSGSLSTVNGRISIGEDCTIRGSCRSVNGDVTVGDRSQVEDLTAVNGSIRAGSGVKIDGDVDSVNGDVSLEDGSSVTGDISTINGSVELEQALVQYDLRTVNGDIRLRKQSVVRGDIVIEKKLGNSRRRRPQRVEISGGSIVEGNLIVEDAELEVRVLLRDGGEIRGRIENAEVEREGE